MSSAYVVITPVRNEARFLPLTVKSLRAQTLKPVRWVIVDDGSTDQTLAIAEEAARSEPWIQVVRRGDRGFRLSGQGVVEAFYDGYRRVEQEPWEFISKFDGDLSFDPDYFERCLAEFVSDPRLGIGGGMCCAEVEGRRVPEFPGDPPFHVRGPTKIYRRACWEQIGGLPSVAGWDGIDELKANMLGWRTRTFRDVLITHHRPTGSADGVWKNQAKFGRANFIMGYHPLFMAAKLCKRVFHRPYVIGAAGMAWGYIGAWLRGVRQIDDPALIRFVREEQLKTLRGQESIWRPARQPAGISS
ncbi:MAG TPA: glycosyltransferase family A protein [Methylomirabilota bacterium]|nr:glycosyltransferase family A protein [Methylomirabilota bacterium]